MISFVWKVNNYNYLEGTIFIVLILSNVLIKLTRSI